MKNLKKVLALVLSLAMMVSTFTVSFAAETKTDAEIATALDMLRGDGDGVTEEYLAESTTRFQAAVMFLRLKGLEKDAMAFEGTENFSDADEILWAPGKAMLAYLKANPELGWVGTGDGFKPLDTISAQAYYKVMLEALGYKQGTDFEWAGVLEFAAEKGLKKAADAENFTNNDIAVVTVETLQAENSEGKKLVDVLVEAKVIADDVAKLVPGYVVPVTAKMTAAKAIDATTITVTFDEAVTAGADDFTVVAGDKDFAISSATSADAGKVAVLTVAELTVGSKYTVTYGEVSKTVVPTIKDDKTKPAISSANAVTAAVLTVVFGTRNINQDTLVADNFSLNNDATVLSAELNMDEMKKSENVGKTVVTLSVSGLKAGKAYEVKSTGVTSYEGAKADESKATFAGKDADDKAPKVTAASSEDGYLVKVFFEEDVKLDESTAIDISNYSITPELEITEAKIDKNIIGKDSGNNVVILRTAFQKSGTAYTLKVDNISDGTNVMKEAEKVVFAGKTKPDNQKAEAAQAINATKVEVTFASECNDTALDISNYEIDKDITVTAAEFKEDVDAADKLNQKVVVLTTSEMKSGTAYTLTVKTGVQDVLGQGLKESKKLVFAGKDKDTTFDTSISAKAEDKTTVKVTFNEPLDRATALDVANYSISDLGYPSEVTLDSEGKVATLKVQEQKSGVSYTITLNNIKDKAGNVVKADTKVKFTGKGDIVTDVRVSSATAMSKDKIKVVFNQKLVFTGNTTYKLTLNDGTTVTGLTAVGTSNGTTTDSDIVLVTNTSDATKVLTASNVYKIEVNALNATGYLTGHTINTDKDSATFVGSDSAKATYAIESVEALDKTHIKVNLAEALKSGETAIADISIYSDDYSTIAKDASDVIIAQNYDLTNKVSISTDRKSVIYTLAKELKNSTVYYLEIGVESTGLADYESKYADLAPYGTDKTTARKSFVTGTLSAVGDTKIDIASVVMMDNNTLEAKFNIDLEEGPSGSPVVLDPTKFVVKDKADGNVLATSSYVEFMDSKTVRIYFNGDLLTGNSNGIYFLKILASSNVKAKVDNTIVAFGTDKDYEGFAKNAAKNEGPSVVSVEPVADSVIKVTLSERAYKNNTQGALNTDASDFVVYNLDKDIPVPTSKLSLTPVTGADAHKVVYLTLADGKFLEGANYQIGFVKHPSETTSSVYGVDGIVPAKAYVTATSKTDNSINFGGSASAMAAPTAASLAFQNDSAGQNDKVVAVTDLDTDSLLTLDVYIHADTAPTATSSATATVDLSGADKSAATALDVTDIDANAGEKIWYRYVDSAGYKTAWTQDGRVPMTFVDADIVVTEVAAGTNDDTIVINTTATTKKLVAGDVLRVVAGAETLNYTITAANVTTLATGNVTLTIDGTTITDAMVTGTTGTAAALDTAIVNPGTVTVTVVSADGNTSTALSEAVQN